MPREVIFRGYSDTVGWKYGYYAVKTICQRDVAVIQCENENYIVNWETIDQYTGMNDRNGKKVFGGDILKIYKKSDALGTYYFPPVEYPALCIVRWDFCSWMWEVINTKEKYYIHFPDAWCHYECEVIGNVWDRIYGGEQRK